MPSFYRRPGVAPAPPKAEEPAPDAGTQYEARRKERFSQMMTRQRLGRQWGQIMIPSFHAGTADEL